MIMVTMTTRQTTTITAPTAMPTSLAQLRVFIAVHVSIAAPTLSEDQEQGATVTVTSIRHISFII